MEFRNVKFEKRDSVGYITLNNPEKRNPINIDTHRELRECFDLCDYDDEIRAVVIRGAGGNFSAGGDLNAMKARIDAGIRGTRAVCRVGAETNLRLLNVKKPVIAWIEGAITGAGISLALSCDFQIISETSKCAFSFVNIGLSPAPSVPPAQRICSCPADFSAARTQPIGGFSPRPSPPRSLRSV